MQIYYSAPDLNADMCVGTALMLYVYRADAIAELLQAQHYNAWKGSPEQISVFKNLVNEFFTTAPCIVSARTANADKNDKAHALVEAWAWPLRVKWLGTQPNLDGVFKRFIAPNLTTGLFTGFKNHDFSPFKVGYAQGIFHVWIRHDLVTPIELAVERAFSLNPGVSVQSIHAQTETVPLDIALETVRDMTDTKWFASSHDSRAATTPFILSDHAKLNPVELADRL